MTVRNMLLGGVLAFGLLMSPANAQDDDYTIRLVAGSPGYDHIQPFMAELRGFWEKYDLNVDFIGGNYQRSNQLMSIGDFDVGYNQYATAIRYNSAGIGNVIVAASSANCAQIVAAPDVESWEDVKGQRFGIVTKFDVQYLTLIKHILPRFGLTADDVQLSRFRFPRRLPPWSPAMLQRPSLLSRTGPTRWRKGPSFCWPRGISSTRTRSGPTCSATAW
jgi:ABC-type nitrate/sulfonate/bicarbonate transport system substrate-binding protein